MGTMISSFIRLIFQLLTFVILIDVVISFFLSPYHPFRAALDRFVNPMLNPIRKIIPPVQMFDFSPVILLLILQFVEYILLRLV